MVGRSRREEDVQSITAAPRPHSEDIDYRIHRYLLSMGIRTGCVILVLVINSPWRWVFAVGAVFLPYVAVVMANAGQTRRGVQPPALTVPAPEQAALDAAPVPPPRGESGD
jgi:hypothetical protein